MYGNVPFYDDLSLLELGIIAICRIDGGAISRRKFNLNVLLITPMSCYLVYKML
jgi:hypothetical protein